MYAIFDDPAFINISLNIRLLAFSARHWCGCAVHGCT
jgi:hypothetical protein